jgi:hypothetical protein
MKTEYTIKVLKDTPFDKANTILSLKEFRERYTYIFNKDNSDQFVINYLTEGYISDYNDRPFRSFFEVIAKDINDFKVGDWVWHQKLQEACNVVISGSLLSKESRPNYATIDAVNGHPDIYKRLATPEEIQKYKLHSFCDGEVLIGQHKCYYFNTVWKELIGVKENILHYINYFKISTGWIKVMYNNSEESKWLCTLNGLKVGCKEISHQEIMHISNILKIT